VKVAPEADAANYVITENSNKWAALITRNVARRSVHVVCSFSSTSPFVFLACYIDIWILCSVDRASLYNLVNETNLVCNILSIFRQFYL